MQRVEIVVAGHQPEAPVPTCGSDTPRRLQQGGPGTVSRRLCVQREELQAAVRRFEHRGQADGSTVLLGHQAFQVERIDELAQTRDGRDTAAVAGEQLGGPGTVGRFEIADAQDQLPR
jgi:hypothetical protein